MLHLIKRPVITEKSSKVHQIHKHYVFEVERGTNKIEIAKAVESMFQVKVDSVRTVNVKGKYRSRYTKKGLMRGTTKARKKAYVRLQDGYSIDIVSGEGEQQ